MTEADALPAIRSTAAKRPRSRLRERQTHPLWFVGPFAAIYLVFFAYPLVQLFVLSFTHTRLGNPAGAFIGIANYLRLVTDSNFWGALGHTLLFVVLTVVPLVLVSLALALLVLHARRLRGFVQAAFFLPYILPVSVVTIIWAWLLNPHFGIINYMLGIDTAWLDDTTLAMPAVAGVTVWWTVGFNMLLFMAGLQTVPTEVTQAAELDGATSLQVFRHVVWPLLWPTTSLVVLLQVIASLKIFSQVYLLTAGGPGTSTRVLLEYMFDTGFTGLDTGYASTIAVAIFFVIVAVSAVQAKVLASRGRG